MSQLNLTKLAFVDIETTGTRPTLEGIIEVAVILVDNNEVVEEWSTLVNPQTHISSFIENYTGISNADVADAPIFEEIAEELLERLSGRIFVAHNVRFDYGFIKNAFRNCGIEWRSQQLCTVKLSRRLFPEFRKHNLDAVMNRHGITCFGRHRALGDAHVMWEFWQQVHNEFSEDEFYDAVKHIMKIPAMPLNVNFEEIDLLPEAPGVYFFYGEGEKPIYIGKSVDIRKRVLSHFSSDHRVAKDTKIAKQLQRIEYEETAGELEALIRESRYIKEHLPVYNRMLRRSKNLYTCMVRENEHGYKCIEVVCPEQIHVDDLENIAGIFRSKKQAEKILREISKHYNLCDKILGLENAKSACFQYHLKKCKGACVEEEPAAVFNIRLDMAFANVKLQSWPYEHAIGLVESHKNSQKKVIHVVYKWCYLGMAEREEDIENILTSASQDLYFDYDTYKILLGYIFPKKSQKVRYIEIKQFSLPHTESSEYEQEEVFPDYEFVQ